MRILPAIDIRDGRCVRLSQGDFARETVFDTDPVAAAQRFADQGAEYLHIIDLDGARTGKPVNLGLVAKIVAATGLPCQVGGGLRNFADIDSALDTGVDRVILGTQALCDQQWLRDAALDHPGRIALGIDVKDGRIATHGWAELNEQTPQEFLESVVHWPIGAVIYTDIAHDGMLNGPNFAAYSRLLESTTLPVIASGGVTTESDIRGLAQIGVAGCIIGRALYEGRIHLESAIAAARESVSNPRSVA